MAGSLFSAAAMTESGRAVVQPGETECCTLSSVDITCEGDPRFPHMKGGILILTTFRLIWVGTSGHGCASSFPLASVSHVFSPKKSIKTVFSSPRIRIQAMSAAEGESRSVVITLTIRAKVDVDSFLSDLWDAWRGRAWESAPVGDSRNVRERMPVVGVSGILRKEQEEWENTDKTLTVAFQDLNALMSNVKEVVTLAEKMRQKLLLSADATADDATDDDDDKRQDLSDLLLCIGIVSPVTKVSAGALYHQQLSRQLADFVKSPLERAGGLLSLVDAYCLFNRARGNELISPDDMLQACSLWHKLHVPVMLRKFSSGVMVIQSKSQNDEEVFSRIKALMQKTGALQAGAGATDAAQFLGIAPAMAREYLLNAESKGLLCRDTSVEGLKFFINLFPYLLPHQPPQAVRDGGVYASWIEAIFPT